MANDLRDLSINGLPLRSGVAPCDNAHERDVLRDIVTKALDALSAMSPGGENGPWEQHENHVAR
eukprot:3474615-Lingulodinium_polyedra.AAC.1